MIPNYWTVVVAVYFSPPKVFQGQGRVERCADLDYFLTRIDMTSITSITIIDIDDVEIIKDKKAISHFIMTDRKANAAKAAARNKVITGKSI